MNVYQSDYGDLIYSDPYALLELVWFDNNGEMGDENFRMVITAMAEKAEELKPVFILTHSLNFKFRIPKETMQWIAEAITPRLNAVGIEKFAILMPRDVVANITVQETRETANDQTQSDFSVRYFSHRDDAVRWFTEE